jgi:uncharacterized membrane protein YhhN
MTTLQIILLAVCTLLAILFIIARTLKGGVMAFTLKTLASFGFVTSAIIGLSLHNTLVTETKWALALIVIGLLLGMIGDMVLDLKVIYDNDKWYLNTGMTAFFFGHICYIVAFSLLANLNSLHLPLLIAGGCSLLLTTGITLSSKKMGLDFGKFLIQTITYTVLLTLAMVYSLVLAIMGGGLWLTFVGLLLFFLSDIVLSFQYFGGKIASKPHIAINHTLYYAAQIILVAVLFLI